MEQNKIYTSVSEIGGRLGLSQQEADKCGDISDGSS